MEDTRWTARWIWADGVGERSRRNVVEVRRTVHLDQPLSRAPGRIFADSQYVLSVNGVEVARGPGRGNPRSARHDLVDLAPFLAAGDNIVSILGVHHGRPTAWWMPAPLSMSGLDGGAIVFEADLGPAGVLATGSDWEGRRVEGWTSSPPTGPVSQRCRELVDLRAPDDVGWAPVAVKRSGTLGDGDNDRPPSYPFGPMTAREVSTTTVVDVPLRHDGDGVWSADRVVAGTLVVTASGPPGAEASLSMSETFDDDGLAHPFDEEIGVGVVVDEETTFETLDRFGLRSVTVDADPGVDIGGILVRERLHPVTGDHGFRCSDPTLDKIHEVGRRTVSICSFDAYLDCPTREQRAWTGDSVVHQMVDLTTNDDWTLATWHPQLAASPRPDGMLPMAVSGDLEFGDPTVIPDWALHWVRSVWNLHRYVGDDEQTAALLPVVERVLDWFEPFVDPSTGLPTNVFGWVIIDWASVPTDGASAALTGLLARALLDAAEMAEHLGDGGRAGRWRHRHERLRVGFEHFWDDRHGRYRDTFVRGQIGATGSQHAQAAALVGGLVPAERHELLVDVLVDADHLVHTTWSVADGPAAPGSESPLGGPYLFAGHPEPWWDTTRQVQRAQPFFRYVVHDALVAAGRSDLISTQLLDWTWLLDRCDTSWSECWFGGTTSHGWSSTPTRDTIQRVLGVTPDAPGFTTARVEPALGHLDWAAGSVPTPHGPIELRVEPDGISVTSPVPVACGGRIHPAGTTQIRR